MLYRLEICVQIRVLWVSQPSVEIVFAEAGPEHGKARLQQPGYLYVDLIFGTLRQVGFEVQTLD